jgi:V/A-type H+-transporting ATPase subunit I
MFYPARMYRVTLGIDNTRRSAGIGALHETGMLEVIPLREFDPPLQDHLEAGERDLLADRCAEYRVRLDRVLEALYEFPPSPGNFLKELVSPRGHEKYPVTAGTLAELLQEIDSILNTTERALEIRALLMEKDERLGESFRVRSDLELLQVIPFDLSALGESRFLSIYAASAGTETAGGVIARLAETCGDEIYVDSRESGDVTVFVVACISEEKEAVESILQSPGITPIRIEARQGLPGEVLKATDEEISQLKAERDSLQEELAALRREHETHILALREELLIRREELDLVTRCGVTGEVTVIQGFVPASALTQIRAGVGEATEEHHFVSVQDPDPEDSSVPVHYENPPFLAPFEYLTTMFARPRYDEIDPTPFVAPIFLIFFGLMLGDAGYGILIALVGYLIYRGAGRVSTTMRDLSYILTLCGISAIIFGAIQGGWFGDVPQRFFGMTPPFVLIAPLKDPIAFFQISLILGIVHINLGLLLAFYQNFRKKRYRACIFDQGIWYILQPSAGVLLAEFFGWAPVHPWLHFLALAGAALSIAMIFYTRGPMGFFSLTGFLGDWLSYVRILALALATGGIAMTVNILAQIVGNAGPLLLVPAIIVFLGGQAFNVVIQALGGVIHAIRLQYIEFFGKFYQGGGKAFTPFRVERMYSRRGDGQ